MVQAAIDFLLRVQNSDGGWGAGTERRSNTEATSLALLGLYSVGAPSLAQSLDRGLKWLVERQHPDGSWPLTAQLKEGSWATALAVLSLTCFEMHSQIALRGVDWLLHQKGRKLGWMTSLRYRWAPHTLTTRLNPDLQGWPWTSHAFSWVEPTSYALIALKKLLPSLQGTQAKERIREGELLLYDRMCQEGGWNYGNSTVLGEDLPPYPDTTAVALIALQDYQTTEANQLSLQALRHLLAQVESGLTLSWSILCFVLYDQDVSEWQKLLARNYEKTGFLGETKSVALALLASSEAGATIFRI